MRAALPFAANDKRACPACFVRREGMIGNLVPDHAAARNIAILAYFGVMVNRYGI